MRECVAPIRGTAPSPAASGRPPLPYRERLAGAGSARSRRTLKQAGIAVPPPYRSSTSMVATDEPPPAVTFSSGSVAMRVSAPSIVFEWVMKGAMSTMRS